MKNKIEKDAIEALYQTLAWKDLYDPKLIQEGMHGQKMKTTQELYKAFEYNSTEIFVNFYIVQNDAIWKCDFYNNL